MPVGQHDHRRAAQIQFEHDLLAQRSAEHRCDTADDLGDVDRLGVGDVAPGKCQQLAGQCRAPFGRRPNLAEIDQDARIGHAQRDQRGVIQDDAKQVVEVMGDTAGELAQAVEAMRLLALSLQLPRLFGAGMVEFEREPGVVRVVGQLGHVRLREERAAGQARNRQCAYGSITGQQRHHGETAQQ